MNMKLKHNDVTKDMKRVSLIS